MQHSLKLLTLMTLLMTANARAYDARGEMQCLWSLNDYNYGLNELTPEMSFIKGASEQIWKKDLVFSPRKSTASSTLEFAIYTERTVYKCSVPRPEYKIGFFHLRIDQDDAGVVIDTRDNRLNFTQLSTEFLKGDIAERQRKMISELKPFRCHREFGGGGNAVLAMRQAINKQVLNIERSERYIHYKNHTKEEVLKEPAETQQLLMDVLVKVHRETIQKTLVPCGIYLDDDTIAQLPRDIQHAAGIAKIAHKLGVIPADTKDVEYEPNEN